MIVYDPSSGYDLKSESFAPVYEVKEIQIIVTPGTSTPGIVKDANVLNQDAATVLKQAKIDGPINPSPSFTSLTPLVASVSSDGFVARVSDGTAKIRADYGGDSQRFDIPVKLEDSAVATSFVSWRAGSLAKFVNDRINTLITGLTPSDATRRLFDGAIRNPSMFFSPYAQGLTSVAYAVGGSPYMGFTAITARHVVGCSHIGDYSGQQVSFVTTANVRVNRTLVKAYFVPGYDADTAVYLLDSALPTSIVPAKLAPTNVGNYLPNAKFPVPFIFPDRDQLINIARSSRLDAAKVQLYPFSDSRAGFYNLPQDGTSGKPIMIPYGSSASSLCILGTFTYRESGPSLHALPWTSIIPALDASAGVSTGLQPVRASFAAFTAYP